MCAYRGGADSSALALLLWERGEDFEMVFADTGAELPENYWLLPRLAAYVNKPLHVVSNGSSFEHLVATNYMLPGLRARWCTRSLKMEPQDDFFAVTKDVETVAIGIRADEPRRVHTKKRLTKSSYEPAYPLADAGMGKKDVRELCDRYGLLNPVYEWRSSVSCFCCFFQRKYDWIGLWRHHPTLFMVAEQWEAECSRTSKKDGWLYASHWALKDLRQMDEQQLKLIPEPEYEPCLVCGL